jgi:hypothetical protein
LISADKLRDLNNSPDIQKEGGMYDGGMALAENHDAEWHPYNVVQHPHLTPRKTFDMIPDNRVKAVFKKQLIFDFTMRLVLLGGGMFVLLPLFS